MHVYWNSLVYVTDAQVCALDIQEKVKSTASNAKDNTAVMRSYIGIFYSGLGYVGTARLGRTIEYLYSPCCFGQLAGLIAQGRKQFGSFLLFGQVHAEAH